MESRRGDGSDDGQRIPGQTKNSGKGLKLDSNWYERLKNCLIRVS